ncbi:MAG: NAD(+) synthase [Acidobacteriota bacterium]|nr:NAD(+) synthase [Acidobacteriota bacterium]MDQ7087032.1 NAD(+) synthase [Acidobacteriota bacterium]
MPLSADVIRIDPAAESERLAEVLRRQVRRDLRRQGGVVGVSGGVDSAVVLCLAVKALGPERVVGIMMPDRHSSPESVDLARELGDKLGVELLMEDVTPGLEGLGCYRRQTEAVRHHFPEFDPDRDRFKIHLAEGILDQDRLNYFLLTVEFADGTTRTERLGPRQLNQIVAATNFKQRARTAMLYYHGESLNYAVIGTCNRNEWAVGFIVKHGDIAVDLKPIQHLYKSQVYALADYLGVPEGITSRPPTSDTYSAEQTQEEFFFSLPFQQLDLLLYGWENKVPEGEVAAALGLGEEQVRRAYRDLMSKHRTTEHMRHMPLTAHP